MPLPSGYVDRLRSRGKSSQSSSPAYRFALNDRDPNRSPIDGSEAPIAALYDAQLRSRERDFEGADELRPSPPPAPVIQGAPMEGSDARFRDFDDRLQSLSLQPGRRHPQSATAQTHDDGGLPDLDEDASPSGGVGTDGYVLEGDEESHAVAAPSPAVEVSLDGSTASLRDEAESATGATEGFDARFQECVERILDFTAHTSMADKLKVNKDLAAVAKDFLYCAKLHSRVIISELHLPHEEKTLKPLEQQHGIAGGEKYIAGGVLFKVASAGQGTFVWIQRMCARWD
jgi:Clustered mitochondria